MQSLKSPAAVCSLAFAMCVYGFAVSDTNAGAVAYRTVALEGLQAPGFPDGVTYRALVTNTVLNSSGQTAFVGFIEGPGIDDSNDTVLYSAGAGLGPLPIAQEGDQAPGFPAGTLFTFIFWGPSIELNDAGQVKAIGRLSDPGGGIIDAIFIGGEAGGPLEYLIHEGGQVSGTDAGTTVTGLFVRTPVNGSGRTVQEVFLTGPEPDNEFTRGIISGGVGDISVVVQQGGQIPGLPEGVLYEGISMPRFPYTTPMNNAGQFIFQSSISGPGWDTHAILLSDPTGTTITPVVREGDSAPDVPEGTLFDNFDPFFNINDNGHIIFTVTLSGPGVNFDNDDAIYLSDAGGTPSLIARDGDQAPGLPAGVVYHSSSSGFSFELNNENKVAFATSLAGPGIDSTNDSAIYVGDPSTGLTPVVRKDDTVPGLGLDARFKVLTAPDLNDAGAIAFSADIEDDGETFRAIFATDPSGSLHHIAAEGELFDIDDDPGAEDLRTVSSVNLAGTNKSSLNNLGQVLFRASFEDGTDGFFVATIPNSTPCNAADFAEPFGLLDLADTLAFVNAFTAADPAADLDPNGLFDLADVLVLINAFNAGCP